MKAVRISVGLAVLVLGAAGRMASAQETEPAPGRASVQDYSYNLPQLDPWDPRFRLRSDFGDGVGYDGGYQTFSGFLPVWSVPGQSVFFIDPRVIVPYDGDFAANVGAGFRFINEDTNRIYGASFWYDHDNSYARQYHQYGVSLESLGQHVDLRFNAYLPNNADTFTGPRSATGLAFVGTTISVFDSYILENAFRGGDFEVGGALPFLGDFGLRTYVGAYLLDGADLDSTVGTKFRADALVTQDVAVQVGFTKDNYFGTNVTGAVSLSFPLRRDSQWFRRPKVRDRLYAHTERNHRIAVFRRIGTQFHPLTNPADNQAFRVAHVRNNAGAGGTGTAEAPFNTLPGSVATDVDIIFVQRGTGAALDGAIVLANNQRLLGDGVPHLITAVEGVFTLPGTFNGLLPTLTNTNVFITDPITGLITNPTVNQNVITLANNNEVAGFNIVGSAGNGIRGSGISDFNINRNNITGTTLAGISLENASGTGLVSGNTLTANTTGNLVLLNTIAGNLNLQVTGNTISGSFARGVDVTLGGSAASTANISNNILSSNDLGSIFVDRRDSANVTTTINQNTITGSVAALDGIAYRAAGTSGTTPLSLTITNNTIDNGHMAIDTLANAAVVATVSNNTITDAADSGIRITSLNNSSVGTGDPNNPLLGTVAPTILDGNLVSTSGTVDPDAGIRLVAQDNALHNIQITGTSRRTVLTGNRNGISISNVRTTTDGTQSPGTYLIQGTDIVDSDADGINLALRRPTDFPVGSPPSGGTNVTIGGPAAGQNVTIGRSTTVVGGDDGIDATLIGNSHTLTVQNTTIDRTGGDGILVSAANATGTTINVQNSSVTRSGGDGINLIQVGGFVTANVTGTSSTFNTGRGLNIFVTNTNQVQMALGSSTYNIGGLGLGNVFSNNGQQGLLFTTVATLVPVNTLTGGAVPAGTISSSIDPITDPLVANVYHEFFQLPVDPPGLGVPNPTRIPYDMVVTGAVGSGTIPFDPNFAKATLVAIGNQIQNNGADGLALAVGTNTRQSANISGNTFSGNQLDDVRIFPIDSGIAIPASVNNATGTDILVKDPVASLQLVFGSIDTGALDGIPDTSLPNIGEQINVSTAGAAAGSIVLPITITQSSGATIAAGTTLTGLIVAADPFKPANRSTRGMFEVAVDTMLDLNVFTQQGVPQPTLSEFVELKPAFPLSTPPAPVFTFPGFTPRPAEVFPLTNIPTVP